jgi:hypothetical protein
MIACRVLIFCIGGICCAATEQTVMLPPIYLPPVNLAATETAQIGIMSSAAGYVGYTFVAGCTASVTFYGADGSPIGTSAGFPLGDRTDFLCQAAVRFYRSRGIKHSDSSRDRAYHSIEAAVSTRVYVADV